MGHLSCAFWASTKAIPAWQNAGDPGGSQALGACATISLETSLCGEIKKWPM